MQYLSSRSNQKTPWMSTPEYYNNESGDAEYIDTKSRSRNSTTDMCVEKNTEGKPPYSYATLIKYAIERSTENKLTLSQIYQWVIDHYPYYGSAGSGWKNSIRHNLSLNKSFVRVPRPVNEPGKGSYWTVDQYAIDTEQRVRTNVRGRSSRSSSDSSLHNPRTSEPWLLVDRNYRDGRSQSTDAGVSSSAALRRTSQYGYCSHPYGYTPPQQNYYGRQHSSVTYSLPNSNIPFYSHRQSCPDLSSTYSETIPNFNTAGNEACLESPSGMCDNKMIYTTPFYSKVFAPAKGRSTPAGLPSPVLSPSNCSSTTSSQHLSVADPLSLVTQHPSPVTGTETPNNRTSPYYKPMDEPSSPLHMISPRTRSPVPFFHNEAVAYIDMVSQQQHQNASPSSSSSSPHQFAATTNPFLSQTERFDYPL